MEPIGYEMEALTAVRTVSDFCMVVDSEMTIAKAKVPGRHVEQSRSWIANTGTNRHD
jgi:molybdenum cofactor biosynthesis enzyme